MDYREYASEVTAMVESGTITADQAREGHALSMLLAGFIHLEMQRGEIRAMFDTNDRERFVEGLRNDPKFMQRFGEYAMNVRGL